MSKSENEFRSRSENCMNRALQDIRRVGRLGDRYLFSDVAAETMIKVLRKEINRAEVELQKRQPPALKANHEFTWDHNHDD